MSERLSPQREAEITARWGRIPADEQPRFTVTDSSRPGALLDAVAHAPEDVLTLAAELKAERADNSQLYSDLTGANLARWEEENDARRARLAATNARKRAARLRTERDQLQRRFDELETLGRELLSHCTAEYGGPGYTHCELPAGHEGQHESPMGHLHRATWGPTPR